MEAQIAEAADRVWQGLEARYQLWKLIQEHPELGPTRITQLTDYLYRPEHVSRIAAGPAPKPPKQRRRATAS